MEASLCPQGDDLLTGEGKLDLRAENGHTWIRAGTGDEWQSLDDFSSAFAPDGDWLALLTAAQETVVPDEAGQTGGRFTRYLYRLDQARLVRALQE